MESTTSSSLSLGARSSLQQQHGSSYPSTPASDTLGGRTAQARPPPSSISTAPSAVPTLQQPSSLAQSFGANPRPSLGVSHSFSRSSSATMDQRYQPYADLSGNHHYSQASSNIPSNSPLALADIRPRGEQSSRDYNDEYPITQTTSAYVAPWPIYGFDWCKWPVSGSSAGKMAICSHLEDPHNFIQILDTTLSSSDMGPPGASSAAIEFTKTAEATCAYPVTRILWEPPSSQKQTTDLLATSGDHLRLWSLPTTVPSPSTNTITRSSTSNTKPAPVTKLTPLALLSNSKTPEHTAPLTSLDWNKVSPKLIITSSIDTTCTIWDIPTLTAKTQLIAHDKEVFDVRFCAGSVDTFVSCGADGSVRMFDLRSLEHSTIIYEPSEKGDRVSPANSPGSPQHTMSYAPPLLRLAASPHDSHLLATFAQDSRIIRILDHRQPGQALLELHGHAAPLACLEWSPTRRGMLASGADDSQLLYWDLINPANAAALSPVGGPAGGFGAPGVAGHGAAAATTNPQQQGVGLGLGVGASGLDGGGGAGAGGGTVGSSSSGGSMKGPAASWRCDVEVSNLSWAPGGGGSGASGASAAAGEWLGVTGGKAVWGVRL